jgi:5-methyltetrahydrofolate--homocysteine methyltransferase
MIDELRNAVITGADKKAEEFVRQGLAEGKEPIIMMNDGLIPAMEEVGERFNRKEYFVPEVLLSARAMKAGLAILRPLLAEQKFQPVGLVVLGTVQGDLHDIGKNIVGMVLEGAGFQVRDLGADVPPDKFVNAVRESGARILGMSALLTTTRTVMDMVVKKLQAAGLKERVRVMVGGAAVSEDYARKIGADAFAKDALEAVTKARELTVKR